MQGNRGKLGTWRPSDDVHVPLQLPDLVLDVLAPQAAHAAHAGLGQPALQLGHHGRRLLRQVLAGLQNDGRGVASGSIFGLLGFCTFSSAGVSVRCGSRA